MEIRCIFKQNTFISFSGNDKISEKEYISQKGKEITIIFMIMNKVGAEYEKNAETTGRRINATD